MVNITPQSHTDLMKHLLIAASLFSLTATTPLLAQSDDDTTSSTTSESSGPSKFWQASLPGGEYVVSLSNISSVSKHVYMIDGGLQVTEVVIDTKGVVLARFYHVIPVADNGVGGIGAGLASRTKDLLDQAGQKVNVQASSAVMKQYPTTTHAKTVEFALSTQENLDALFKSAKNAWIKGSGKKFTIKNSE